MRKNNRWPLFLVLLLGVSCLDEPGCFELRNDMVGVTFKVMGTGGQYSQRFDHIATGGTDSLFSQSFNGRAFVLPVNMFADQMVLDFANYSNAGTNKTLTIGYDVTNEFVSSDCGPLLTATNLHIIDHQFDSVRVVNTIPGRDNQARNIEIFRCPAPAQTIMAFYQLYYPGRAPAEITLHVNKVTTDFNTSAYSSNVDAKTVTLPVNFSEPQSAYTFFVDGDTMDINLTYKLSTETRYRPCGEQVFADSIRIAAHAFDSVRLNTDADGRALSSITDPAQTNVILYRCPVTNTIQIAFRTNNEVGTGTVVDEVSLVGITTDYSDDVFYSNATDVSTVQLPLNPDADETTFYIKYDETSTDTLAVQYTRTNTRIFSNACEQNVFDGLREADDLQKVVVTADSLTYPATTNIEIVN